MAMLTLNGLVQNVYTQPASTDRDTGEVRPESLRAQILCENIMESGEKKLEMVTLKVHTEAFKKLVGQKVRIPVGAFVAKGAIMFTRSVMKRNPSRLLEKKIPANAWNRSGEWPVSTALKNNTTDMQSVSRTRKKIRAHRANFPQVTSHSADGARMAGALAHGKPGAGGAKSPACGKARAGRETAALGTNAKLPAPPRNAMARRVERFALQSVARDILPDSRTAKCLRIRAHDSDVQVWKSKKHKTASYGGLQTCGSVWVCPVCGAKVVERRRGKYSRQWPSIAPVVVKCIC